MYTFEPPAAPAGDPQKQLTQVYSYLFRLSEQLNTALAQTQQPAQTAVQQHNNTNIGTSASISESTLNEYNELKSLIIKSAAAVRAEMDAVISQYNSLYAADSTFGSFIENIHTTIEETARGSLQIYDYSSDLLALNAALNSLNEYRVKSEQYIKIGYVDTQEDGTPIVGVAIGNTFSEKTVNGQTYIYDTGMSSVFTADKLSFKKNDVEQAYLSNETLYITNISASGAIELSGKWRIDTTQGFTVLWIG